MTLLRDDIAAGKYKASDLLLKYDIIKKIITIGKVEEIVERNIDKASFAIALLQNEHEWEQRPDVGHQSIQITVQNYSLSSGEEVMTKHIESTIIENNGPDPILDDSTVNLKDTLNNILGEK